MTDKQKIAKIKKLEREIKQANELSWSYIEFNKTLILENELLRKRLELVKGLFDAVVWEVPR